MSNLHEIANPDEARQFLLQGLWLQRVLPLTPATFRAGLEWAQQIATEGQPLPPVGFVADLGHVAFSLDWEARGRREDLILPGLPPALLRSYEDHVLGKVYTDWTFAEAGDYLRAYKGRDQARGLAFVINQFRERAGFSGVELNPGLIKGVLEGNPEAVIAQGWHSFEDPGPHPLLLELYQSLITAARRTAEMLGREDLFALSRRRALDPYAQQMAWRHVLQAADRLEDSLPTQRLRPLAGRQEVPTRVLDEDTYPVGGFSSLANRGSVESLLHSQLAYMEKDERPDLFDIKYLRDELLYYARDENQFLRRRRTFAFVLAADLVHSRFKDAALPYQRIVLLLALLYAAVRKLIDWLSTDALRFVFYFVSSQDRVPLAAEVGLVRTLLSDQIDNGTVKIEERASLEEVEQECALQARRSLCHCLAISTRDLTLHPSDTVVTRLQLAGPCPALGSGDQAPICPEAEDPLEGWCAVLRELLQRWI